MLKDPGIEESEGVPDPDDADESHGVRVVVLLTPPAPARGAGVGTGTGEAITVTVMNFTANTRAMARGPIMLAQKARLEGTVQPLGRDAAQP